MRLLIETWELDIPNLVISVTGGAKSFQLKPKLKEAFTKGLIKCAVTTNAWIITGKFEKFSFINNFALMMLFLSQKRTRISRFQQQKRTRISLLVVSTKVKDSVSSVPQVWTPRLYTAPGINIKINPKEKVLSSYLKVCKIHVFL